MYRWIALLLPLLFLPPPPAAAQSVPELRAGDTIRVARPGALAAQGIVLQVSEGAISFQRRSTADTLTLPLSSLARLDVARGRATNGRAVVQGVGLGLLVGALAGASWEFIAAKRGVSAGELSVGSTVAAGGIGGLLIGALVGIVHPTTRWVPVRIPEPGAPGPRVSRLGSDLDGQAVVRGGDAGG